MSFLLAPFFNGDQCFLPSGSPNSGGKINTYVAGSTTAQATYTSSTGAVANANPIVLDANGYLPYEMWLTAGSLYKFVVTDSASNVIATYDDVAGIVPGSAVYAPGASSGASLFLQSGTGATPVSVQSKLRQVIHVNDFGADPTGATDSTAAIQAALNYANAGAGTGKVFFGAGSYLFSSTLTAGKGVALIGAGKRSTTLKCASSFTGSAAVALGTSGGLGFDNYLQDLCLNCNSAVGTGLALSGAQEGCGARSALITGFNTYGIDLSQNYPANVLLTELEIWGNNGAAAGIIISGGNNIMIHKLTALCVAGGSSVIAAGVSATSTNGVFNGMHFESCTDGLYLHNSSIQVNSIDASTTTANVTNLIHDAGAPYSTYRGITKNSATNAIYSSYSGLTLTSSYIPFLNDLTQILNPPVTVTPTGSPFQYHNTTNAVVALYISGGNVTSLKTAGRTGDPGTVLGITSGTVLLVPSEILYITYTSAPTVFSYAI